MTLDPKMARAIARARTKSVESTDAFHDLIRQAIADDASYRQVAEAAGLTHPTVHYIVNGKKR